MLTVLSCFVLITSPVIHVICWLMSFKVATLSGDRPVCRSLWWRHRMITISALLPICAGNSPVTGEFPAQRLVSWSFDVSLICARINGWVNNREAGDLRRHRAHYDVTVIQIGFYLYLASFDMDSVYNLYWVFCFLTALMNAGSLSIITFIGWFLQ